MRRAKTSRNSPPGSLLNAWETPKLTPVITSPTVQLLSSAFQSSLTTPSALSPLPSPHPILLSPLVVTIIPLRISYLCNASGSSIPLSIHFAALRAVCAALVSSASLRHYSNSEINLSFHAGVFSWPPIRRLDCANRHLRGPPFLDKLLGSFSSAERSLR